MKKKLVAQPRIRGVVRIPKHSSLHPDVWHGIKEIAYMEGWTISRVMAEIVSRYFGIDAATGIALTRNIRRVK